MGCEVSKHETKSYLSSWHKKKLVIA